MSDAIEGYLHDNFPGSWSIMAKGKDTGGERRGIPAFIPVLELVIPLKVRDTLAEEVEMETDGVRKIFVFYGKERDGKITLEKVFPIRGFDGGDPTLDTVDEVRVFTDSIVRGDGMHFIGIGKLFGGENEARDAFQKFPEMRVYIGGSANRTGKSRGSDQLAIFTRGENGIIPFDTYRFV